MSDARILIAGIGNVFLGDDGFGVEVVRRMTRTGSVSTRKWLKKGIPSRP